jgi:hypothetical protein
MYSLLEQSILKTLLYFDVVHIPLTSEEVFYYLWQPPPSISYQEVLGALRCLIERGIIEECYGFFYTKGNSKFVEERRERVVFSEVLLTKAYRAIKLIRSAPFLRAVFVCNSIASETATAQSDIDFFIITHPKRIWTVRFLTNCILFCCGMRRYGKSIAQRICLSFYITEDALNISEQRIFSDDVHFIYWLEQMLPVYDPKNMWLTFKNTNAWTKFFLPNFLDPLKEAGFVPNFSQPKKSVVFKKVFERVLGGKLGDFSEMIVKKIQSIKMKSAAKNKPLHADRGVFISDSVIKLHEQDSRRWYREQWLEKIKNYDFSQDA